MIRRRFVGLGAALIPGRLSSSPPEYPPELVDSLLAVVRLLESEGCGCM